MVWGEDIYFLHFSIIFPQKAVITLILKHSIKNMKVEGGTDQNS